MANLDCFQPVDLFHLDGSVAAVSVNFDGSAFAAIDLANINSKQQTIISGLYDEVLAADSLFADAGQSRLGKFVFHLRLRTFDQFVDMIKENKG